MTRSIHEQIALDAIAEMQVDTNPNADPIIDYINDGMRMRYYTPDRAESLIGLAQSAERQQRDRLRQARELMGRAS